MRANLKLVQRTNVIGGRVYPTYLFKDHDPVLDWLATAIKDSGMSFQHICNASGVARQTLDKWYLRRTKRPQFATIAAVAKAIGKTEIPLR